ncbi:Alkaline phosphatase family protein [uncultured Gammaproteobacteria bacterium]
MTVRSSNPVLVVGPILLFRGEQAGRWRVSALFVLAGEAEPFDLEVEGIGLPVPPRHLTTSHNFHIWRFDFAVPLADKGQRLAYRFVDQGDGPDGSQWGFSVPGRTERPRLAYVSGGGADDEDRLGFVEPGNRLERWRNLAETLPERPAHILLLGGGQVEVDGVWQASPTLAAWATHTPDLRQTMPFTRVMADQTMDYYFKLYCRTFSQPEIAAVLAEIPAVMMWDDRDIFSGWGSLEATDQSCQVVRGLQAVAKRHFSMFQLGTMLREPAESVWGARQGTFSQGLRYEDLGILALDLRSDRNPTRVLSEATWAELPVWLRRFAGCRNLLVMSGAPLIFPEPGGVDRILSRCGIGSLLNSNPDDRWSSPGHVEEAERLLRVISDFGLTNRCRITFLSGKEGLGAAGTVRDRKGIWQMVAGEMVQPPPSGWRTRVLEWLSGASETLPNGLTVDLRSFAETGHRLLRSRSWLELEFDHRSRVQARWHTDRSPTSVRVAT